MDKSDGVYEFWYDGIRHDNRRNVVWLEGTVETGRAFRFISFMGNNYVSWTNSCSGTACEQWYAIDDIVIATENIGSINTSELQAPQGLRITGQ